jgi:hypothetical protein
MSSVLLGASPSHQTPAAAVPPAPPTRPAGAPSSGGGGQRNNTLTVIAGVGVLLLAMGVGVLIGRSGVSKQSTAAPQVITVASSAPSTGTATTPAAEAPFAGDWPSGKSGYTVQLQTLPQTGTTLSAVESAKSAVSAKGAKAVGALKSDEFSSLSAGSYVIYAGMYSKKPEAEKALAGLKKGFPGAKVVKVSNGGGSSASTEPPTTSPGGVGESESHPAPPSVLKSLKSVKGKSYEEKSKNLPDVVED